MGHTPGEARAKAAAKEKGKGIATSSQPRTKTKGTTKQTQVEKKKGNAKPKKPNAQALFDKFISMPFDQTKFVDKETLEQIGIRDDVMLLFENMGVGKFMSMQEEAHEGMTCEFLATFSTRQYDKDDISDRKGFERFGRGRIEFHIGKKEFEVSYSELCEIFGFPEDDNRNGHRFGYEFGELPRVWDTIASGQYEPGNSKLALIRNPAIRYAYKALMHVLYAKIEVDTMTTEGIEFIGSGLAPILRTHRDGGEFIGPDRIPCLATLLARSLVDYKEWAWKTKAKKAFIGVGWMVTAILKAKAREVQISPRDVNLMDMAYLQKARFVKRHENGFAYLFHPTETTEAKVLLPNPQLTRLDNLNNVIFDPPQEFYLGHVQEDNPEPIRGAARYAFEPYSGPMNTATACSNAHERINLLHRLCKFQQRTIEKMAKSMKKMKRQIKELSCKRGDGVDSSTRMETSGEESSQRTSRKGKGKRRAPTPSPQSSNESIDLATDSSASASPTPSQ